MIFPDIIRAGQNANNFFTKMRKQNLLFRYIFNSGSSLKKDAEQAFNFAGIIHKQAFLLNF